MWRNSRSIKINKTVPAYNSGHTAALRPNTVKPNFACSQNVVRNARARDSKTFWGYCNIEKQGGEKWMINKREEKIRPKKKWRLSILLIGSDSV